MMFYIFEIILCIFFLGCTTNNQLFFIVFPGGLKKIPFHQVKITYFVSIKKKKTLVIVAIKSVLRQLIR